MRQLGSENAPATLERSGAEPRSRPLTDADLIDEFHGPRTTTLYRFYNRRDQLLYVGITYFKGIRRFSQHKRSKGWWEEVDTIRVEHFTDRIAAREAELKAIERENPRYNLADVPATPPEVQYPEPALVTVQVLEGNCRACGEWHQLDEKDEICIPCEGKLVEAARAAKRS